MTRDSPHNSDQAESKIFLITMAGVTGMGVVAYGLSLLLRTPLAPQFTLSSNDALIGVIATLPLVLFLWWFSRTDNPTFAEFRNFQIKFFSEIGFEFTFSRIVLMSLSAGIFEELLFRGVFQTWLVGFVPLVFAIAISNIVFGLLHMRTVLYAIIAGIVGAYLGFVYAVTDNLLAPMIAHTLYDFAALIYTRKLVSIYQAHEEN